MFWHLNFKLFKNTNILLFIIIYIIQIIYINTSCYDGGKLSYITVFGPIQRILVDIKLLCIAINSIDNYMKSDNKIFFKNKNAKLRCDLTKIIKHHEFICR